jgi:hypothetical protein
LQEFMDRKERIKERMVIKDRKEKIMDRKGNIKDREEKIKEKEVCQGQEGFEYDNCTWIHPNSEFLICRKIIQHSLKAFKV